MYFFNRSWGIGSTDEAGFGTYSKIIEQTSNEYIEEKYKINMKVVIYKTIANYIKY